MRLRTVLTACLTTLLSMLVQRQQWRADQACLAMHTSCSLFQPQPHGRTPKMGLQELLDLKVTLCSCFQQDSSKLISILFFTLVFVMVCWGQVTEPGCYSCQGPGPHSNRLGRIAADNWLGHQQHLLALSGWCWLWTFSYFGVLKTTHVLWLQTEWLLGATFWILLRASIPWLNLVYRPLALRQTLGGQSLGTCISPGDCSLWRTQLMFIYNNELPGT